MPATAKKKAAPRKGLIKYAEPCLKPKDGFIAHPLYLNDPDILRVFPKKMFKIHTGLEVAVPPNMALHTNLNVQGVIQMGSMHFGYQKELVINCYNITDSLIEIDPYQVIGSMFLTEIKSWG